MPQVVARIYDPRRADIYRDLGIPTVASVRWTAGRIHQMLAHRYLDPAAFGKPREQGIGWIGAEAQGPRGAPPQPGCFCPG